MLVVHLRIFRRLMKEKFDAYSVSHIITYPSKELCSIMAQGKVDSPLQ